MLIFSPSSQQDVNENLMEDMMAEVTKDLEELGELDAYG